MPVGSSLPFRMRFSTWLKSGTMSMNPAGCPFTSAMNANCGMSSGFRSLAMTMNSSFVMGTKPQFSSHAAL